MGVPLRWFNGLNKKYEFHDVKLSSQIKYAYHALAIDERRKIFEPTLWEVNEQALTAPDPQVAQQVWFPGVHSNVGGGYADSSLSDITLQWVINKASATGLDFDKNYAEKIKEDSAGELRKSDGGIYNISPKIFREINNGVAIRTDPDTGKQSKVKVLRNESIHYTYFQRHHKFNKYQPANVVHSLTLDTPFDPVKEKWEEGWREDIKSYLFNYGTF